MTVQQYYAYLAELNRKDREMRLENTQLKLSEDALLQRMDAMMFLQGQQDCKDGKPHEAGKGESYDRGFAAQYSFEETMSAMFDEGQSHEKY